MKKQFPRIGRFILANLAVSGIAIAVMVAVAIFCAKWIEEGADNRALSDLIIYGAATLSFVFPLYFLYFLKDDNLNNS